MIWLLNKLNQEILDSNLENYYGKGSTFDQNVPVIKTGYSINLDKKDNKEDKKIFHFKTFPVSYLKYFSIYFGLIMR